MPCLYKNWEQERIHIAGKDVSIVELKEIVFVSWGLIVKESEFDTCIVWFPLQIFVLLTLLTWQYILYRIRYTVDGQSQDVRDFFTVRGGGIMIDLILHSWKS